jgi:hypothetical protein
MTRYCPLARQSLTRFFRQTKHQRLAHERPGNPLLSQICDKTSQKRFGKGQNRAEMGWAPVGPLMGLFSTEMRNSLFY